MYRRESRVCPSVCARLPVGAEVPTWVPSRRSALLLVRTFQRLPSSFHEFGCGAVRNWRDVRSGGCGPMGSTRQPDLAQWSRGLRWRFQRRNWGLVVMDLGVDTSTIMGAAMAQMVSVFAELERKQIAARTKEASLAVQKAEGVKLGREAKVPKTVITRIKRQRARGDSLRKIATDLNDSKVLTVYGGKQWYASTVRSVLARTA